MSDVARITVTVNMLMKDGSSQSTKYTVDTSVEPFNVEESISEECHLSHWCNHTPKPVRLKISGLVFCLERAHTTALTVEDTP